MSVQLTNKDLKEIEIKAKIIWTVCLSLAILFLIIYLCLSNGSVEDKYIFTYGNHTIEKTIHYVDLQYISQWAILVFLVAIIWIWRKKFGIEGFGPVQGKAESEPSITPLPGDQPKTIELKNNSYAGNDTKTDSINEVNDIKKEVQHPLEKNETTDSEGSFQAPIILSRFKTKTTIPTTQNKSVATTRNTKKTESNLDSILKLFNTYKSLTIPSIATILGVNTKTIYRLILSNKEHFKIEDNGLSEVVTIKDSPENITINHLVKKYNGNNNLRFKKQVLVGNIRLDLLLRSRTDIFFIKLYDISIAHQTNHMATEISRMYKTINKFTPYKKHIVCAFMDSENNQSDYNSLKTNILNRCKNISQIVDIEFVQTQRK